MTFKEFLIDTIDLNYEDWVKELKSFNEIGEQLVLDLDTLIQDTKWHPELYVLKHTRLVLQSLKEKKAENLYEAGLFHDWGKRYTTLIHRNRAISSFGHARYGVKLIDDIESHLDKKDFENTRWVIERHMDFDLDHKRFKEKDQYTEPYDLLETFIWADKSRSRERFIETEEGKREYQKNIIILNELLTMSKLQHSESSSVNLYIKIGSSGSGKSTCKTFNETNGYNIICPDLIRKEMLGYAGFEPSIENQVWLIAKTRIADLLARGENAVLDATNVNRYSRTNFIANILNDKKCRALNIITHGILYPYTKTEELRSRIENDMKENDRSDVPINIIAKQNKNLIKSMKEGFTDLDYIIKP